MAKYIFILFIYLIDHNAAQSQNLTSRLRMEVLGFSNVDFNYFSKGTQSTTSDLFHIHTALGKMYSQDENRGIGLGRNERIFNFEYGFLASYEINPKWDIRVGVLSASAGSFGNPGVFGWTIGGGASNRVFKFLIAPSLNIWYSNKHKMGLNISIAPSLDIVRNDWSEAWGATAIIRADTLRFMESSAMLNKVGISAVSSLQYYLKLENNNRLNIILTHSLGFIPLLSNNYWYGVNQANYYTEVWSNGTFIRLGIGYEFQLLKKWFGYHKKEKINGTNKYMYK